MIINREVPWEKGRNHRGDAKGDSDNAEFVGTTDTGGFVMDGEFVGEGVSAEVEVVGSGDGSGVGVGVGVGVGHGFSKEFHSCHDAVSLPPNSFQSA